MEERSADYIVVGAGSAGCVLANRLSEDPANEVLLLEAGGPDNKREISIPAAALELFKTEVDWEYYTEPQPEMNNHAFYCPRGKVLGGTSSINHMVYTRGHPDDYDQWEAAGNDEWSYDNVLPYFKKSEHNERGLSTYHGTDGPLIVTDLSSPNPLSEVFVKAGMEIGFPHNTDFNTDRQYGVGLVQVTQRNGKRHSAADAYLTPVTDRPNLTIQTRAHVTRILFVGNRAIGVEFYRDGTRAKANANQEVIVSAGTVNSPKLLMLSGIGPADHLREHGVDIQTTLPGVGRNLQNHVIAGVIHECTRPITLDEAGSLWNFLKYLLFKTGPLTSNGAEAAGFVKTSPEVSLPDLQLVFAPFYFMGHGFDNPDEGHGFSLGATQLRPASRGHIKLRSSDPFEDPVIDPRYLSASEDMEPLIEGIKIVREIAQAAPFDDYRGSEIWPGRHVQSDDELADYIRERAQPLYHHVGTCKMGNDDMAVVDDRLRVNGVTALRVVDASIMPTLIGGSTNAPTIMIAEKAADLIEEDREN